MDNFQYKNNKLFCEGVSVESIAKKYGTPLYLYSQNSFIERYLSIVRAFEKTEHLVCFSVKTNSNLSVLKTLVKQGAGLDIVSGGELFRALKAGCSPKKIVYAGVGKRPDEIEYAIKIGILLFNVESLPELEMINKISGKLKKKTNVALRINPDVDAKTHKYITTGKKENKFGIDLITAAKIFKSVAVGAVAPNGSKKYRNINISGIHLHIGSQITLVEPYMEAVKKT
ncbi:MAG: diaminopimelate decarboxylase, partial [Candidatus Omnitrophica bacterium]|nr:diaminopimelate decarboxylase [Candidatus Omnitrophota bacterium]